jgi:transcriptional regulator with XRE-family HTH domain
MLGERLLQLIDSLGIKKGEFATQIGFSSAYISMILKGKKSNPSARFYEAIIHAFHVNPQWLRTGKGRMFLVDDPAISEGDAELIEKYRSLPAAERKIVEGIIETIYAMSKR